MCNDFDWKLSKLPTPEETTLSATGVTDEDRAATYNVCGTGTRLDVCHNELREVSAKLRAALRERDALKAEVDKWKSYRNEWVKRAETAESKLSQSDAVVGRETPQDAFERGQKVMKRKCASFIDPKCNYMSIEPYTPPLKAGKL